LIRRRIQLHQLLLGFGVAFLTDERVAAIEEAVMTRKPFGAVPKL